jgi:hypothetical protein
LQANSDFAANNPQLVMDASGIAIVGWSGYNGSIFRVYTTRYRVDTGWTNVRSVIDSTNTVGAGSPTLAVDRSGDVLAVWLQSAGVSDALPGFWENRFQ